MNFKIKNFGHGVDRDLKLKTNEDNGKNYSCALCYSEIKTQIYYFCIIHGKKVCVDCANNGFRMELPFENVNHCLHNGKVKTFEWKDCIMEIKHTK